MNNFIRNCHTIFRSDYIIFHLAMYESLAFSVSLIKLGITSLFNSRYSSKYELVSQSRFFSMSVCGVFMTFYISIYIYIYI